MKPRSSHLWIDICDDKGKIGHYSIKPLVSADPAVRSAVAKSFRLTITEQEIIKVRTVKMDYEGSITCDCPGFESHHHCKHVSALVSQGVLDRDAWLMVRGMFLALEADQAVLRARLAANPYNTPPKKVRKSSPKSRRGGKKTCKSAASSSTSGDSSSSPALHVASGT